MVFDPATLVSYVSHIMTLLPGDVILTGTPAGVSPIVDGDTVVVRVVGIDLGERRIGVAVSDASGTLARPPKTIERGP